ncbi:MAG: acyl-CoA thioesterase [Deinococcales bacterium]
MQPFSFPISVRFADLDMLGHVNNAVYFSYVEQARLEFLAFFEITSATFPSIVLARAECNHLSPILLGHQVEIKTWVTRIGTKSFELAHEVYANSIIAATLKTVLVWYDHKSKTAQPIPDEIRAKLNLQMLKS